MVENGKPYAPPENLERIFKRARSNGWPPKVNADYLLQIGLTEANIPRVLVALRSLGITDETGSVTQAGENLHLASEAEWPLVLQDILRTAYADIFKVVNPEQAPRQAVRDAFRPMRPTGQQDRMVTMFLGLCALSGMNVVDVPYQRPGQGQPRKIGTSVTHGRRNVPRRADRGADSQAVLGAAVTGPTFRLQSGGMHPALAGVLQAVPELETAEDLERWIESFRATFLMVKKVKIEA